MSKTPPQIRTITIKEAETILDGGYVVIPHEALECSKTTEEIVLILLELGLMQQAKEVSRRFLSGFSYGKEMFAEFFCPILRRHRTGERPLREKLTFRISNARDPRKALQRIFPSLSDDKIEKALALVGAA